MVGGGRAVAVIRSMGRALFTFLSLYLIALLILLIPSGVRYGQRLTSAGWEGSRYDLAGYWGSVRYHVTQLLQGNLLMLDPELHRNQWMGVQDLPREVGVTLMLVLGGLLLSTLLGTLLGCLSTRLQPVRLLQKGAAGFTLFLSSVPDILVLLAVQLAIMLVNEQTGSTIPVTGQPFTLMTWEHFILPLLALGLIPAPYWAKLVAAALKEASGQLYVRTAKAKGLPPLQVAWGHIGRNALPYIWASLPVMLGLILSATPMVEYLLSVPGIGTQLVKARAGYRALFYLAPLLAVMSASYAATTYASRWVDPVVKAEGDTGPVAPRCGFVGLPATLRELAAWLWDGLRSAPAWPRRVLAALWSNGPLLAGGLVVLGVAGVALFAHKLAPYHWTRVEITRFIPGDVLVPPFPPNPRNLLGSDGWGRDYFSLLIWGCRYTVLFATVAVPLRLLLALPLGMMAARGGVMGRLVRMSAVVFSCLPTWLMPLALIPAVNNIFLRQYVAFSAVGILLIALPGVPRLAESVRLHVRELWGRPFVEGARAYSGVFLGGVIVNTEAPREVFPYMPEWG